MGWSKVAVLLPEPPRYHSAAMDLRVEIDRADVWYEYPWTASGRRRSRPPGRRPTLTLFARDGEVDIALVRWPTTVGGWQRERLRSGAVTWKFKGSPAGDFVWRDVIAAPVWFAPPSTPHQELVRRRDGRWVAREDTIGPGYRSAYGLVMLMHHRGTQRGAEIRYADSGIRTHGTVSYLSVLGDGSHGCHRLLSSAANRLGSFLLRHRAHTAHGNVAAAYARRAVWGKKVFDIRRSSRGYRYQLLAPVPVRVLRGGRASTRTRDASSGNS
jgi:hypothetical protein